MGRNKQPVIHTIGIGEQLTLEIDAGDRYSMQRIAVKPSEAYLILCDAGQHWIDLIIPSSPDGYTNYLARLFGLRVKGAKCFCLCGAWNESDERAFDIGTKTAYVAVASKEGTLSFFANDVWGYEWNNWGSIEIKVKRTL